MKNYIKIIVSLLFVFMFSSNSKAQLDNLTFTVRASNFLVYDTVTNTNPLVSGLMTHFKFDIYIQQTNTPGNDAEIMRFALGQYYWNLNYGAGFPGDTTGFLGYASVSYVPGSTTFSNPNAIPTSPTFLSKNATTDIYSPDGYPVGTARSSIRMNSNIALGSSSDVQVSQVYPGTRVGTFVVRKKYTAVNPSPYFPAVSGHMRFRQGPLNVNSVNPFTKIFAYPGLGGISTEVTYKGTFIMDTLYTPGTPVFAPGPPLKLSVIPQGFYNYISNRLYKKTDVRVELRKSVSPYNLIDYSVGTLDSISLSGVFMFSYQRNDSLNYVVVKHKNCLETWSSIPVNFNSDTAFYNFSLTKNMAYGSNQKQVDNYPVRYGILSGNINGDAIIDAEDLSAVENDAEAGLSGDIITDLTGDYYVDANDLSITENNAFEVAMVVTP